MAYWLLLVLPLDREKKKSKTRDIIREAQRGDFVPHVLLAGISSAVALTVSFLGYVDVVLQAPFPWSECNLQ